MLAQQIAELAEERPAATAIVEIDGRTLTWAETHAEILQWAAVLQSVGVEPGATVVTMVPNSAGAFTVWLGVASLQAIEVPANNMFRGETLRYLLEQSEAEVFVVSDRYIDRLALIADELTKLRTVVVLGDAPVDSQLPFEVVVAPTALASAQLPAHLTTPERWDIAAMIYTSGTTGPSKGVLVPWGEFEQAVPFTPDDYLLDGEAVYTMYPAYHLTGKAVFFAAAFAGAQLVIRETFSVTEFWDDIRRFDVRAGGLIGPIAAMLMQAPEQTDDADNPLERLVVGPIIPNIEDFCARFGVKRVTTGFGMTEIGFPISSPWNPPNHRTCGRRREGPPGYEVKIVDEHDQPVPTGEVGELVVRSYEPWTMNAGYWRMPEVTARAWRNGWFHTGDVFTEDEDGWLYFVDRMKDALRRRGENISSFEVEAGILRHPAVAEAAVVATPSDLGEDEILAFVVEAPGTTCDAAELIEFLIPRLPRFMIPRFVEIVASLPKTDATMRVRKIELRERGRSEATWDRELAGIKLPKD